MSSTSCYDSSLLWRSEGAPRPTLAGNPAAVIAGAGGASSGGAGAGGSGSGAGAGPGDVTSSGGPARCGDGRVDAAERCDTGIPEGLAGACPEACSGGDAPCSGQELVGEGCDATCQPRTYGCSAGDGCCPASCDAGSDGDCSASCGDGQVQTEAGETCEPGTASPCPHQAECDDADACTVDTLSGSEANCSASCLHTEITELVAGDGCCPEGANANGDDDCPPVCGNAVLEPGEECDSGDGCDAQCTWTSTPEQRQCLMDFAVEDDCRRCKCIACTEPALDCFASGEPARDASCTAIEVCGRENDCSGSPCYCGTSTSCGAPNGPCKTVIETAAGSTSPLEVDRQAMDPATAIARALALATCSIANCSDVCP